MHESRETAVVQTDPMDGARTQLQAEAIAEADADKGNWDHGDLHVAALAAERKATVERIREALDADSYLFQLDPPMGPLRGSKAIEHIYAILDAEAAGNAGFYDDPNAAGNER